jgi:hypothetical protein
LFKECPKKLADVVVNNDRAYLEPVRQPPNAAEVRRLYEDLWGRTGPLSVPISESRASELSLLDQFPPITDEDVGERINKMRKKAAAGPDDFKREHLLIPGLPAMLAKVYDICWYSSYFPTVWKKNRTTLIPKTNKSSSQVENWRPITIGPVLGRIFSSVIDGKIRRGIVLSPSENGCKINIDLLSAALDYSKRDNGGIFTIADISEAFDTIPHSALKPCLERKDVPTPIINVITKMYDQNKTTIKAANNIGVEVKILRGVKQGDPLSQLLFNLCIEPLIEMIEGQTSGININSNRKVPILAFVDDIVVLGGDEREAQRQVDILHGYLKNLGMKISRDKSQTFQVVAKKDTWFIKDPEIGLDNNYIPAVDTDEAFRYLGAKMGP